MVHSSQASFRLAWGCTGKKTSRRHKHDIVSFERGDITTASRSSKQVTFAYILLVVDVPARHVLFTYLVGGAIGHYDGVLGS